MFLYWFIFVFNCILIGLFLYFAYRSIMERAGRAARIGLLAALLHLILGVLLVTLPGILWPAGLILVVMSASVGFFLLPLRRSEEPASGTMGYAAGERGQIDRVDERDIVFARNRSLVPGRAEYERYYNEMRPDLKEADDRRRARGGPLGRPGSIDGSPGPLLAMLAGAFQMPTYLGPYAKADPQEASARPYARGQAQTAARLSPEKASMIVKGWARHLGADLVGICRVDPLWAYSHRGEIYYENWEDWGKELPEPLPYAVVIATEMDEPAVATAPHTPSVVESAVNYSKGAYITTILAQWFAGLGYRAVAEHNRHYDLLMVPLAVDAGLGEMGRQGYLIADRFGPRVRLFAVQTDMPLQADHPIDLGAREFCRRCLKCADSCPSKAIPGGPEAESNGIRRWKLDAEKCFDYWGKVGTDCCICMAVCPFSRPDRSFHRLVRWILKRSGPARKVFPYADNILYGKKWRPKSAPDWMSPGAADHGSVDQRLTVA